MCPGSIQLRARDIKSRLLSSHATCIVADTDTAELVDQVTVWRQQCVRDTFRILGTI